VSRRSAWIEWTRSRLSASQAERELGGFTPDERARLERDGWVWKPGRVSWLDPRGDLHHTLYTHGAYFRTAQGEFHIDSEGRVHSRPEVQGGPAVQGLPISERDPGSSRAASPDAPADAPAPRRAARHRQSQLVQTLPRPRR
jgi:hypothetical protein